MVPGGGQDRVIGFDEILEEHDGAGEQRQRLGVVAAVLAGESEVVQRGCQLGMAVAQHVFLDGQRPPR